MSEEDNEIKAKEKGHSLYLSFIQWLANADIDFSIVKWESGEGVSVYISDREIEIEFYDSGYIDFINTANDDVAKEVKNENCV